MSSPEVKALQRKLFFNGTRIPARLLIIRSNRARVNGANVPEIATTILARTEGTGSVLRYTFIRASRNPNPLFDK